jgi:hypothetical protein
MEAMLGISLYSYPYLNWQKWFTFLIIAYVFSLTKLEKRADRFCPEVKGGGGKRNEAGGREEKCPKQCMHM